jgi:flagellar motor switch protein FliN/FliY
MVLGDVLSLGIGSIIELQPNPNSLVELIVNGRQFARGEVVSVDGCYGIRIADINKSRRADDALYEDGSEAK